MRNKKLNVIRCPSCGREYLPSEIYLPNSFLGKVNNVMRMNDGSIEAYFGSDMNLKEKYICDGCGTNFSVVAKVSFKTFEEKEPGFKEEYSTKINKKLKFLED